MKITIRSSRIPTTTVEGNPVTLKDVKELFKSSQIDFTNLEFVDRFTKASYIRDEAKIPNREEILFYLSPLKNKSGGGPGSGKKATKNTTPVDVDVFEEAKVKICGIIDELKDKGATTVEIENLIMGLSEADMDAELKSL